MDEATRHAVDQILEELKRALAENDHPLNEVLVVTIATRKRGVLGNGLQDVIDRSDHDLLCWRSLQCLDRVSREADILPAEHREWIQATVDDPRFRAWRQDVVDGTRSAPRPGRRTGRRPKPLRKFLVVHALFALQELGVGVTEACRLVGTAIYMEDVYRDIWRERDEAHDRLHEVDNVFLNGVGKSR